MTVAYASIDAVIARAEQFLESGFIKCTTGVPALKRPGTGLNRGKGRAFEWLCQHVAFDEKKCLFWPFSKCRGRAGAIAYCGKTFKPVRLMCLLANGDPPTDKHEAVLTCGRGNNGCIHPKHLAWRTASERMYAEFREGRRISYGKGGKITPSEAEEIRALGGTKTATEIGKMYGLSGQRIGDILRGTAHVKWRSFNPREGRFYPRLAVRGQCFSLGGFSSVEKAAAAYEAARTRVRQGKPVLLSVKDKPSVDDVERWYRPPQQHLSFGDREGEIVETVAPVQEQSVVVLHNALERLSPVVRKFVLIASSTGDADEAAEAVGLSKRQLEILLPRLRMHLGPLLNKAA